MTKMKNKIPELLQQRINIPKSNSENLPNDVKEFMIEYSKFYDWGLGNNIRIILKYMKKSYEYIPQCGYKNCNNKCMVDYKFDISKGCCASHSYKLATLEKHGVENISQVGDVKEKKKLLALKKYGVENVFMSSEIKDKTKKTNLEKYGCEHNMQNTTIRSKAIATWVEKYGVGNPLQNANIFEKSQKRMFRRKEYKWKTGEISIVQGNEPIVLTELEEKGYSFSDVRTDQKDMPEIWYEFEEKNKRYYSDIYIPKENLLIEVKSEYTIRCDVEKNTAKFDATRQLGYELKIEVR